MRTAMAILVVALVVAMVGQLAEADVHVRGHFRRDGTYVRPHWRSDPDGNVGNNWSTYPNVNPYTGKVGTRRYPSSWSRGHRSHWSSWSYRPYRAW